MAALSTTVTSQREFERLFQRSQRRAYNLAYRLTGNATDAEDVTQDAYMRAWNNFANYDSSRSFEGWLFRIITNRVIDLRRRQKRVPMYSLDTPIQGDDDGQVLAHEFPAAEGNPEQLVVGAVMEERLQQALAALPADYREAILLCDVEQRSYQEIAERMNCAIGTVRSRIHRARVMLRRYLETGVTPGRTRRIRAEELREEGRTRHRSATSLVEV
ncbi:MAG: sigma-70 family RNA polymerase sigma factor [Chloroherpetonaceae bacterium]|nr:sigma-70 family RNA polymerase sigma factor [Chthonomonadaceae bacterium]MDW8208416.1 sigma-70 family RNA polymerase sigma factor [Chloroherpetonaceae bacterium]